MKHMKTFGIGSETFLRLKLVKNIQNFKIIVQPHYRI